VLRAHAGRLTVVDRSPVSFALEGTPGPSTLRAWRGERRRATLPVGWVSVEKNYVGYHLMGLDPDAKLSDALRARLHGKTCFNFREVDPDLAKELGALTRETFRRMHAAGFVA